LSRQFSWTSGDLIFLLFVDIFYVSIYIFYAGKSSSQERQMAKSRLRAFAGFA